MKLSKRGSLWNKWDLHVHTPFSIAEQHYGNPSEEATWEKFISDLEGLPSCFKVLGLNDYLFIDGYKKVLEYKRKNRLQNIDTIFPVIELRLKRMIGNDKLRKINFHIIFSDELSPELLQQQFLSQLHAKIHLSPLLSGYKVPWSGVINHTSLEDFGKSIKNTVPEHKVGDFTESNLKLGFNNITFEEDAIIELMKGNGYLKDKYLTAIGKTEWADFKWNDSGIADKKDIINKVHFVFISSENIAKFHVAREHLKQEGVNHLLIDCSDAHRFSSDTDKDRIGKCFSWIKADTTFEGLRQVLINPEGRLYIGDQPEIFKKVASNQTKYIDSCKISKKSTSSLSEIWFDDIDVKLSSELVAIIGNKGNGKSALTDIIGLLGNAKCQKSFSFLCKEKFRDPKNNKAHHYKGELIWKSMDSNERGLEEDILPKDIEMVKYIPQSFFETMCNNKEEKDYFEKELKKVIFSHVPEEEKLFCDDLDELIFQKSNVIDESIDNLLVDLREVNKKIVKLIALGSNENKEIIQEKLKVKKEELAIHDANKIKEVPKPGEEELKRQEQIIKDIEQKNANIKELETLIDANQKTANELREKLSIIAKIKGIIQNFKLQHESTKQKVSELATSIGVDSKDFIQVKFDISKITALEKQAATELGTLRKSISPEKIYNEISKSLEDTDCTKLAALKKEVKNLNDQLDEPNRKYQTYLKNHEEWKKKHIEIDGSGDKEGTIKFYQEKIDFITNKLSGQLELMSAQRTEKVKQIYQKKKEYLEAYKSLYMPVEDFIGRYKWEKDEYQVEFDASLEVRGFIDTFFEFIHQGIKGTYYGLEEGRGFLEKTLAEMDFNNEDSLMEFLSNINASLEYDKRSNPPEENSILRQIKSGNLQEFYDYLFSLKYLFPAYRLKLGGRELSHLSPGEKGALLLIFYLLIDKDSRPLIIDQPEENLDNQSVYELLVQIIKEAKKHRQIIIVTHNPNLAVVCDAEQIICAKIDKSANCRVTYETGSIENPSINEKITDILEGTLPAFDVRDNNYRITRFLRNKK